jgi:hypothetical protein
MKHNNLAFLFAAAVCALPLHEVAAQDASHFDFPACMAPDGQSVAYIAGEPRPADQYAIFSIYDDSGKPMIGYNPVWIAGASPAVKTLIAEHECAHHRKGHVLKYRAAAKQGIVFGYEERLPMEQEAECEAALIGRDKYSYGEKELKEYFDYMRAMTPEKIHTILQSREDAAMACFRERAPSVP